MERKDEVKVYQNKNVYEAFNHRLEYICGYFDHLIISFSGGKDSGLMLELVRLYYESHDWMKKFLFFIWIMREIIKKLKIILNVQWENIQNLITITSVFLYRLLVEFRCHNRLGCLGTQNIMNFG